MFGINFKEMLSGEGGGGIGGMFGGGIMKMIMGQLTSPETQKLISGKMIDMFDHLAEKFKCDKQDIGLNLMIVNVPIKNESGQVLLGEDGQAKKEFKPIVYVMVRGKAEEKIEMEGFIKMIAQEQEKQ